MTICNEFGERIEIIAPSMVQVLGADPMGFDDEGFRVTKAELVANLDNSNERQIILSLPYPRQIAARVCKSLESAFANGVELFDVGKAISQSMLCFE